MSSPLYKQFQPQNNVLTMLNQFKKNPMAMLSQRFNIPQNIQRPQDMVQHLLDSGQITQEQLNQTVQMSRTPQFKQYMK